MRTVTSKALAVLVLAMLFTPLARLASAASTPLVPSSENGTLVFASADGQFRWWLDGRINLDGNFFIEDKNSLGDGVQIRRSRIAFKSILWGDWYGELDVDLSSEATAMKDIFVRYDNLFNRTGYVRVGNFKQAFGLEEVTSSRNLEFVERSQGLDAFMPGRKMGLEVAHFAPSYRVAASIFGPDVTVYETTDKDMTYNWCGRATFNTLRTATSVLHVGVDGSTQQPQLEGTSVRFKTRNEYHVSNYKYLDTDAITHVSRWNVVNGELAFVDRRLRLQAEAIQVGVDRTDRLRDVAFKGGYVAASYFLTGDHHPYDHQDAEFGRVHPQGKYGAWEVVSRFSSVDMTDLDVHGGNSTATTFGLNWYANVNVRVLCDFVLVNNGVDATGKGSLVGNDDFKFIAFRFQTAF